MLDEFLTNQNVHIFNQSKGVPCARFQPKLQTAADYVHLVEPYAKRSKISAYLQMSIKPQKPWNAPFRQQRFVGRSSFLQQLNKLQITITNASCKENEHLTHIFAVCIGLGGIGKSSIALQFIYQNMERYEYVFWIPSTTCEGIENCLTQLGAQLCLPISNNNVQLWKETVFWLQANPGWLMVFDDAPNFSGIESYIPSTGGHVLVTSRYTEWPWQTLNITPFTNEETTEYVQLVLPSAVDKAECAALAEALGNLPLAISQATAYMSKLRIGVSEYMVTFNVAQRHILSSTILPPDCKSKSVYFTWNVSVEQAKLECGFAVELLAFCSLFDHNNVPENLTCEFAKVRNCSKLLEEAQAALFSYSLMSISSSPRRGMSIHPLVQAVTRSNLSDCEVTDYVKYAFTCVENVWPNEPELNHNTVRELYPSLERCLHYIRLEGEAYENSTRMLLISAQHPILRIAGTSYKVLGNYHQRHALLKRMNKSAKITGALQHDELFAAMLQYDLGNACGNIGDYKQQLKRLFKALHIQDHHYKSDHTVVANTLHSLGNAYGSLGDYLKRKELLEKALVIQEKHYGPDHTEVAATLHSLGIVYGSLGEYQKRKELLEKALVIKEKHYGPDHTEVAATLHSLGNAHASLGDYQKQKVFLEKALVIEQDHYGLDHTEVAGTLHCLGKAYGSLGDYQKKKEFLERALVIQEKHFGPDHPSVASTLHCLGNAYGSLGAYHKEMALLKEALIVREKHFGPDHIRVADTLYALGNAHGSLGDYQKQKEHLEKALVINERHYGPDHTEVAATLHFLGIAHGNLGDYPKWKELLEKALAVREKHFGPDHIRVADTLHALGNAHGSLGDYQKQKELQEKALVIKEKHYGFDHTEVAATLHELGNAHGSLGDYQKRSELLEKALVVKSKHYGSAHTEVADTLYCLNNAHDVLGDCEKQRELLE